MPEISYITQKVARKTNHIIINSKQELTNDIESSFREKLVQDLEHLGRYFMIYVYSIFEEGEIPVYKDAQGECIHDLRTELFLAMIISLRDHRPTSTLTLPKEAEQFRPDYTQLGWPVAPSKPHFKAWQTFINDAVLIFKKYNPALDTFGWLETVNNHEAPNSPARRDSDIPVAATIELPTLLPSEEAPLLHSDTSIAKSNSETVDDPMYFKFEIEHQQSSASLKQLVNSIHKMHAYGFKLYQRGELKGHTAMLLSIELFNDLNSFIQLSDAEQKSSQAAFANQFLKKLHSKDHEMAMHRSWSKNIIANLLIALTGFGLIILGTYYLTTGHLFFSKTQSQKNIDEVETLLKKYREVDNPLIMKPL
ncbi:MAG: hypothetical protein ACOVQX_03165 [Legionella sp.]